MTRSSRYVQSVFFLLTLILGATLLAGCPDVPTAARDPHDVSFPEHEHNSR
jgi:hypothetical protein